MNDSEQEVTELLEMLYSSIADAWGVPFKKDKCMVHREDTLSLLDDIRAQLPLELAESRRLLSARDEFISNAKREVESISKAAETEARRMVEEQEIVRAAQERANEIMSAAESKSRELIYAANEYVDDTLRRTEEAIAAAISEIKESRGRFRSAAGIKVNSDIQTISPEDYEE